MVNGPWPAWSSSFDQRRNEIMYDVSIKDIASSLLNHEKYIET